MRRSQIAERYAHALREAIVEPELLDKAGEALISLAMMLSGDASFRHALANPTHALADRKRILDIALKGCDAPTPVARLAHLLLERNRISLVEGVADQFDRHLDSWRNRAEVTVTTTAPLTEELRGQLVAALEHFAGKTVRLKCKIDKGIIGGIVVQIWGVRFDLSLHTRLERLRHELLAKERMTNGN